MFYQAKALAASARQREAWLLEQQLEGEYAERCFADAAKAGSMARTADSAASSSADLHEAIESQLVALQKSIEALGSLKSPTELLPPPKF